MTGRFETTCDEVRRLLSRPPYFVASLLAVVMAVLSAGPKVDPDLFARLAMGRLIVSLRTVPRIGPFAFTEKLEQWIDHEWLSGLVFYGLHLLDGDFALFVFKLLMVAATILLLFAARRTCLPAADSNAVGNWFWFAGGILQCVYLWQTTVRSQVFTYFFLALLLLILARRRQDRSLKFIWMLPPVFVFWANAHGGFVAGLGLFGLFVAGDALNRRTLDKGLLLSLLLSVLATLLNPYDFDYWEYIIAAVNMPRELISEWRPNHLFAAKTQFQNLFMAALLGGIWRKRAKLDYAVLLMLAVAGIYSYRHQRLTAMLFWVGLTFGAGYLDSTSLLIEKSFQRFVLTFKRVGSGMFMMLSAVAVLFVTATLWSFRADYSAYPVQAVEMLQQRGRGGNLLVSFNSGSFALWRLYPKYLVSLDGRYEEVYPESTVHAVNRALSGTDPQALAKINPDYILLDDKKSAALFAPLGWKLVYEDATFAVLER